MWQIRTAGPEDAPGLAQVHVQSWEETYRGLIPDPEIDRRDLPYRVSQWEKLIERGDWARVAVAERQVVAFVTAGPARDAEPGHPGELYSLYILREWHGRGLGRALFTKARGYLQASGLTPFYCYVMPGNPATSFYERMGGERRCTTSIAPNGMCDVMYSFANPNDMGPVP